MAQIKIYGLKSNFEKKRALISQAIHAAIMSALEYPPEKKFHRFIGLDKADFIYPADRSEQYIIIEISMFEGRSVEAKKNLIRTLFSQLHTQADISAQDIEITITETAKENWGIRGLPGDELMLNYKVEV